MAPARRDEARLAPPQDPDPHLIPSDVIKPESTGDRIVTYTAYGLLLLLTLLLCLQRVYDDDIFWQLATGRWIVEHHAIPDHDVFGFVNEGQQWIPVEWLWGVVLHSTYALTASYGALEILAAIVCLAVVVLLILTMRRMRITTPIAIIILTLVLLTAIGRLLPRPHIVTALGLSITAYVLYRWRASDRSDVRILFTLPPIFLLWGNMHPGVLAGLLLVGIALLSEATETVLSRTRFWNTSLENRASPFGSVKSLALLFLLCVGAILLNPHGLRTYTYIYEHAQTAILGAITEWDSPFSESAALNRRLWFYKILLALGTTSLLYSIKRRDLFPSLVFLAFALYSLRALRLRLDFVIATAPGTALALSDLAARIHLPSIRSLLRGRSLTALLAILVGGIISLVPGSSLYTMMNLQNRFGLGIDSTAFPVPMLDFLERNAITGRPFNEFRIGGILLWKLPETRNFIDSRDLSDTTLSEYYAIYNMHPGFETKLEEYKIDHAVIDIPGLERDAGVIASSPIPYFSTHREEWKLVYWDDRSFVYLKNISRFRPLIDTYEYKVLHPYLFAFEPAVFDSLRTARPEIFAQEIRRKLAEEPNGNVIRFIARSVITGEAHPPQ